MKPVCYLLPLGKWKLYDVMKRERYILDILSAADNLLHS